MKFTHPHDYVLNHYLIDMTCGSRLKLSNSKEMKQRDALQSKVQVTQRLNATNTTAFIYNKTQIVTHLLLLILDTADGELNVTAHFSDLTTDGNDVTSIQAWVPGTMVWEPAANTGMAWEPAAKTGSCWVPTAGATSTTDWLTAGYVAVAGVNEIWRNCWSPAAALLTTTHSTHTVTNMTTLWLLFFSDLKLKTVAILSRTNMHNVRTGQYIIAMLCSMTTVKWRVEINRQTWIANSAHISMSIRNQLFRAVCLYRNVTLTVSRCRPPSSVWPLTYQDISSFTDHTMWRLADCCLQLTELTMARAARPLFSKVWCHVLIRTAFFGADTESGGNSWQIFLYAYKLTPWIWGQKPAQTCSWLICVNIHSAWTESNSGVS